MLGVIQPQLDVVRRVAVGVAVDYAEGERGLRRALLRRDMAVAELRRLVLAAAVRVERDRLVLLPIGRLAVARTVTIAAIATVSTVSTVIAIFGAD